ncbi:hypothetical protein [Methylorubrum zatmanii]|uniref:Colicin immunity protein n=1 Tax=Methylorubrum zatmanii TaxID=29429 RepID=A0ABW1WN10_9HYPH|nr:hypothetical protein [Methylorubrum zatmanii]MBD8907185.1 hypothetical protein [Methylorubrum zatmanii]
MTEATLLDDLHYDLACAEDLRACLVDLCARYPAHRDDLVDFACELAAMDLRAAVYPEPPCPPVDEDVAARALARFRRVEAEVLARA